MFSSALRIAMEKASTPGESRALEEFVNAKRELLTALNAGLERRAPDADRR
jgi:hypothetical protein